MTPAEASPLDLLRVEAARHPFLRDAVAVWDRQGAAAGYRAIRRAVYGSGPRPTALRSALASVRIDDAGTLDPEWATSSSSSSSPAPLRPEPPPAPTTPDPPRTA